MDLFYWLQAKVDRGGRRWRFIGEIFALAWSELAAVTPTGAAKFLRSFVEAPLLDPMVFGQEGNLGPRYQTIEVFLCLSTPYGYRLGVEYGLGTGGWRLCLCGC
jgi:hypothetical protein